MKNKNRSKRKSYASRHRSRKSENGIKLAASILTPVAALGLGVWGMVSYTGEEKLDEYGCYIRPDQQKVAIFVDNSLRNLSEAHIRDYRIGFERAYKAASANAKILFFTTAGHTNTSQAEPVFTMCKPASTTTEQTNIGAPDKPAPYLKRQNDEAVAIYTDAVKTILKEVQDSEKLAGDSPILEQLRAISRSVDFSGDNRNFTVITDGIQNSDIANFCSVEGDMPSFEVFKGRGDYELNIKPRSLAGTDVTLLLVEHGKLPASNMPYCSNDELRSWLPAYFKSNGAHTVEVTPLRHWGK